MCAKAKLLKKSGKVLFESDAVVLVSRITVSNKSCCDPSRWKQLLFSMFSNVLLKQVKKAFLVVRFVVVSLRFCVH